MKIIVTLEIEIENPADWTLAFGVEGQAAIRADVKTYARGLVDGEGVFGSGEVDAKVTLRNP